MLVARAGNETSVTFEETPIGVSIPVTEQMLSEAREINGIIVIRNNAPSPGGDPDSDPSTGPAGGVAA